MTSIVKATVHLDDTPIVELKTVRNSDSITMYYLVHAESTVEAMERVSEAGINLDGHEIVSDYDCTGEWFARPVTIREIEYSPLLNMYIVPMYWGQDV